MSPCTQACCAVQQQHLLRKLEQNPEHLFLQLWSMAVSLLASGSHTQRSCIIQPCPPTVRLLTHALDMPCSLILVSHARGVCWPLDAPLRRAYRENCPVVNIVKLRLNCKQIASLGCPSDGIRPVDGCACSSTSVAKPVCIFSR